MLFIFDMDNVLYDYHWRTRMEALTAVTGHSFQELRSRWWHDDGEWSAEAGNPDTGVEYLQRVNDAFGSSISRSDWLAMRKAAMAFRPEVTDAVGFAAEFGQVTLLTNNGILIGEHLSEIAPELVSYFGEHLFATAHYGARKPDPLVFERVLERYEVAGTETFFVDDSPENLRGAQTHGITTQWFSPTDSGRSIRENIQRFVDQQG